MKHLVKLVAIVLVTLAPSSCDPKDVQVVDKTIRDVVSAAQYACIEATALTDAKEVSVACEIVKAISDITPDLLTFVEKLITRREMLKRAGYVFDKRAGAWQKP